MLETGTGPGHLGQILLTNVLNIKKILAILPKQPRQVKMVEKLGKINRLFLHNEEKAFGPRRFLHCEEKDWFFLIFPPFLLVRAALVKLLKFLLYSLHLLLKFDPNGLAQCLSQALQVDHMLILY